jgi:hypothetical protein
VWRESYPHVQCEDEEEHCPLCLRLETEIAQLHPSNKERQQKEALLSSHKKDVRMQYDYSIHLQVISIFFLLCIKIF